MFDNIGGKLKGLAKFLGYFCIICGVIAAFIGAINYFPNADYLEWASVNGGAGYSYRSLEETGNQAYTGLQLLKYGLASAVGGLLGSWPLYGLGELIDNVYSLQKTCNAILTKKDS